MSKCRDNLTHVSPMAAPLAKWVEENRAVDLEKGASLSTLGPTLNIITDGQIESSAVMPDESILLDLKVLSRMVADHILKDLGKE